MINISFQQTVKSPTIIKSKLLNHKTQTHSFHLIYIQEDESSAENKERKETHEFNFSS